MESQSGSGSNKDGGLKELKLPVVNPKAFELVAEDDDSDGEMEPADQLHLAGAAAGRLKFLTKTKVQPMVRLKQLNIQKIKQKKLKPPKLRRHPSVPMTARSNLEYMRDKMHDNSSPEERERIRLNTADPFERKKPHGAKNRRVLTLSCTRIT